MEIMTQICRESGTKFLEEEFGSLLKMIFSRAGNTIPAMLRIHVGRTNPAGVVWLQPLQRVGVKKHSAAHGIGFAKAKYL